MIASSRWSFAEATLLRATGFIQVAIMVIALVAPASLFGAWGLPFGEPATFLRVAVVAYGALGVGLVRAAQREASAAVLFVETAALVKLGFVAVVLFEVSTHRLLPRAAVATVLDVVFGVAILRAARRRAP